MAFSLDRIRRLYDFSSNFLEINGHQLHYLDEGTGEPVVMLHGNPTWSFMYRDLIRLLRPRFRVIAPDHIGCGLSSKPTDSEYDYSLSQRILDIELFLDRLEIDKPITLIVHDWGGIIGMGYATRHPEKIKRLVVFNTAAFLPSGKSIHWSLRYCRRSRIAAALIRGFNAFAVIASLTGCRQHPMDQALRKAYTGPYDSWQNRIATLRFVQDIPLSSEDRSFGKIDEIEKRLKLLRDHPMLICWGMKDFVFDRDFLNEWIKRFPKAETHRFEAAGHYIVEDASTEIGPLVEDFLGRSD
jgi:pimeloyl-ACP methyl ester carboxylesterase